jgi:hypothetical protein
MSRAPSFLKAVKIGRAARQDWLFRALRVQLAPCEHEQLAAAVKLLSQRADFWSNGKEGERWTG